MTKSLNEKVEELRKALIAGPDPIPLLDATFLGDPTNAAGRSPWTYALTMAS